MSIAFVGPAGSCEFPWIQYALLRDNILHHLGKGALTPEFQEVYRIGEALGGVQIVISAQRLHEQLKMAQELCALDISTLAVSARTKAVITMDIDLPAGPPTTVIGVSLNLPWLSGDMQTLGDVFGRLVTKLLAITQGATETDVVEVVDC